MKPFVRRRGAQGRAPFLYGREKIRLNYRGQQTASAVIAKGDYARENDCVFVRKGG